MERIALNYLFTVTLIGITLSCVVLAALLYRMVREQLREDDKP